ncbi:MAG: FecR domain-containing protein [Gammaproteobacteria bacterium]
MIVPAENATTAPRDAARWAELLRDEEKISDAERSAFAKWALEAPEHVGAYLEEQALEDVLSGLKATPGRSAAEWVTLARGTADEDERSAADVSSAPSSEAPRESNEKMRRFWRSRLAPSLVAVVVVGVLLVTVWRSGGADQWVDYGANSGRIQMVALEEGSKILLQDKSLVSVRLTSSLREVRLVAGEANFKVQHDLARRFRVIVPNGTVEAIGTQFDVRWDGSQADIQASEGTILVTGRAHQSAGRTVKAGGSARITPDGLVEVIRVEASSDTPERPSARVQFTKSTLAEIASAFNQRTPSLKFIVEGRACLRQVTAMLNLDNPAALISVLVSDPELTVERKGSATVVIRERGDTSRPGGGADRACVQPGVSSP